MPLQKQIVSVPFIGGVDTKSDPKAVGPGKLLELENGVFDSSGAVKKRNGYDRLSNSTTGSTSIASGKKLVEYGDELVLLDGKNLYGYSETGDTWVDRGSLPNIDVRTRDIIRTSSASQASPCSALANGYYVVAWQDSRSTSVRISVYDAASWTKIIDDESIGTGVEPTCVVSGNDVVIVARNGTELRYAVYSTTSPTSVPLLADVTHEGNGSFITVAEDAHSNFQFAAGERDSDSIFVAWMQTDDTQFYMGLLSKTGDVTNSTFANAHTAFYGMSNIKHDSATGKALIFVGESRFPSGGGGFMKYDPSAETIERINQIYLRNPEKVAIGYDPSASLFDDSETSLTGIGPSALAYAMSDSYLTTRKPEGAEVATRLVDVAGEPFIYNDKWYFPVIRSTTLQSSIFLLDEEGNVVARAAYAGAALSVSSASFYRPVEISSGVFYLPMEVRTKIVSEDNTIFAQTGITLAVFDFTKEFQTVIANDNLVISGGGIPYIYDGGDVVEQGFLLFPEGLSASNGSAGNVADGTYLYKAIYEWTDSNGNIHRSAPSPALTHTVSSGPKEVDVTVPTLTMTRKDSSKNSKDDVSIALYRTTAGGSTVYYRVSSITSPDSNSTTSDSITITDDIADASLTSREVLYTVGGEFENITPSSGRAMTTGDGRIYLSNTDREGEVWFTKEFISNEGAQFSDLFIKKVDPEGGDITALSYMDNKVIKFKEDRIFYMAGSGPLPNGQQDNFTKPILITSDTGCTEIESVVLMEKGIMFKGKKGIYLLARDMSVHYIGADVEAYNGSTITGSVVLNDRNEVRFITSTGECLVFNYYFGQWSVFTNHTGASCCSWKNLFCWVSPDGRIYKENTTFLDDGAQIQLRLVTPWIRLAGMQAFQRVYRYILMGEFRSEHTMSVRIAYDYVDAYVNEHEFSTDAIGVVTYGDSSPYGDESIYGGKIGPVYQVRSRMDRQKCESVKFEFKDKDSTSTGESFILNEIALEIGLKRGVYKLAKAKTVGV